MQASFLHLLVSNKVVLFFFLAEIGIFGNDGKPTLQSGRVQRAHLRALSIRGLYFSCSCFKPGKVVLNLIACSVCPSLLLPY